MVQLLTNQSLGASQVALVVKNSFANARDIRGVGLIPELGRSPGEGNGKLLQYSHLENSMDRGAWWATVQSVWSQEVRHSCAQAWHGMARIKETACQVPAPVDPE